MCGGDLAAGPAQKRLRYLPRHRRQRIRLPVPLQADPGEEISVPRMQGKNKSLLFFRVNKKHFLILT